MKKSTFNSICYYAIILMSAIIADTAWNMKDRFVTIARMLPNGNMDYTTQFGLGFYACIAVYVVYCVIAGVTIVSHVVGEWKKDNQMNYNLDEAKI